MRYLLLHINLLAGLFFILTPCAGQEADAAQTESDSLYRHISREMSAEWSCYFTYAQGKGFFSAEMGNNAAELKKLDVFIRLALAHPTLYMSRIRLTGYCSVEGGYARNEFLSRQRVEQFYLYFNKQYPQLYHYPQDLAWVAEDWGGLSKQIRKSPLKDRDDILEIIRKVPVFDTREALLKKLNGGRAWLYMERELFPGLRRVELRIDYSTTPVVTISEHYNIKPLNATDTVALPPEPPVPVVPEPVVVALPQPAPKEREPEHATPDSIIIVSDSISTASDSLSLEDGRRKPIRFALKTNLLLLSGVQSDAKYTTPVINAALEYYITDHWSVEAGAMYSYWHYNSRREFQGISGYRLEPRYRFARPYDRVVGIPCNHFEIYVGLYGRTGDYDIKTVDSSQPAVDSDNGAQPTVNSQLSTVNSTGDYWDAGLSSGFTFRIVGGLGLEVGARAGYVHTKSIYYTPKDGDNWYKSEKKYNKLRVTDLNLSLIYCF
jgi:hypothetical protein